MSGCWARRSGAASRRGATDDFRFAAAVAEFGMLLRDSEFRGTPRTSRCLPWPAAPWARRPARLPPRVRPRLVESARSLSGMEGEEGGL